MNWLQALVLGIVQGLTEFLPVSSSGHIEIGKVLLGVELTKNVTFTVVIHGATVCSTILVFYKELTKITQGVFRFTWNKETQYMLKIIISMMPVLVVAVLWADQLEALFTGNLLLVGSMLLITAALLTFTFWSKPKVKSISYVHAVIIGVAQAVATLPGISRSGATISTGLILGNNKEETARFSFLMVLIPIIGKNLLDLFAGEITNSKTEVFPLIVGFLAAFFSGWLACRLMLRIVKNSKLIYFAIYCFIVGIIAIIFGF